jgi:virginiamycin B lyase
MSFLCGLWAGSAGGGRRRAVAVVVGCLCGLVVWAWPAVGTAFAVPHIYWSNRVVFTIGEASLDGTGVNQSFIGAGNGPQGLAVDGRHIYWPIVETGAIGEANLDGTGVNLSFITGANAPAGVAVDAQHIYWTNIGDNTIGVANLDGTGVNQSLISFADGPAEVAVDGQHIYWTNFDGNTIGEANKDGTAVNEFFITGVNSPGGVAVDGQHIYWTSVNGNTIGEANLDGTGVNQDFITGADAPLGVAVDGQHIYWTNSGGGTIGEANLDGTGVNQSFITGANTPTGNPAVSVPVAQVGSTVPPPFANTPHGSLSAPSTVTLRNTGQRPLSLTGLSFAGADPSDFLVSTGTCLGDIDPGNSCQLQTYFSPQGQGARSATLQIATNDYANSPLGVQLSGTGAGISLVPGPAVPGPQGPAGPAGPSGPRGPAGARGAAGKVELITCKTVTTTVTKKIKGKRRKVKVKRQKCTGKLVSGKVKFTIRGAAAHATISRKRTVYATGVRASNAKQSSQLVVTELRPLRPGRYTLTLQSRHGRRSMIRRTQITIT